MDIDELADALYSAPPADFVATRDEAVKAARERGDKEFATAAARLRRPTRAAWLANLLARRRREQLDGLLGLAGSLADAQRTLDGPALRTLSTRRRQLVSAMAREAGRLAREAHESVNDSLLRELGDILEAALADPVVADEVRSGRLTRTISYSGFGPESDPGAVAARVAAAPPPAPPADPTEDEDAEPAEDPAEVARREREREERRRDLADAEELEAATRERRDAAEAEHERAAQEHEQARERVAALTTELEAAQRHERESATRNREAAQDARAAAREAGTAATRTARARARLDDTESGG
ncbi:hypothetical protein I4I73_22515 [Pseudonocardia sp. KRD-184]|uniref:Transposase n=1 Tax=Pseudonocardia oceani TaxID=2792013 RepID=A0ABS6UKN8_9PSEU|nr:hypothetical protein [Pseudonocardia oceani]MBW0091986.1 hypothetical protein [Pseudonocardia oceani]MBW0098766.1 hypothetical protein [Pseudonocardia oceani]MBW0111278.1 hypothetical protein [Pseudonocardia oceani]MBW0124036.1 hypothetical protein [Pseudonocardia oceani]MBW0132389.1 hypothetical protein [Pseudonocardia oceani]